MRGTGLIRVAKYFTVISAQLKWPHGENVPIEINAFEQLGLDYTYRCLPMWSENCHLS